jgi:hypothetical protein
MARKYSKQTQSLLRYRERLLDQHNEREGAKHPLAPLARAIYGGQSQKLIPDNERGCVSKLGGVAVIKGGKDDGRYQTENTVTLRAIPKQLRQHALLVLDWGKDQQWLWPDYLSGSKVVRSSACF